MLTVLLPVGNGTSSLELPFRVQTSICDSRSRKIRCDSTRPGCDNCARRSTPCEYDAVPKRRGPDKRPGTRRRSCKKRPVEGHSSTSSIKRRKIGTDDEDDDTDDAGHLTKYEDDEDRSASPIDKSVVLPAVSSLTINTEVPRTGLLNGVSSAEVGSIFSGNFLNNVIISLDRFCIVFIVVSSFSRN